VKGRRRARSAALQALYELDQTEHPLDAVIRSRRQELFRSALATVVPPDRLREVAHELASAGEPEAVVEDIWSDARLDGLAAARELVGRLVTQSEYLDRIVGGVVRNREALDAGIARIAPEWPVEQMAPVDRNILRIALWELSSGSSPVRVAISEAVELARAFSGESSRRLVNGALGTYVSEHHAINLRTEEEWSSP
jgi:transcription antitermination factor NusB